MLTAVQSLQDSVSRRSLLAGAAAAGVLTGCAPAGGRSAERTTPGFPRSVQNASGVTDIPAAPTRVVSALDYDDLDAVLAVGVVPVAFGHSPWLVPDLTPWAQGASRSVRLEGSVAEVGLEKIAAQRPDLIVAAAGLIGDKLRPLQAIAPTVTVELRDGDWRRGTAVVGRATGREAQATAAIDGAETGLAAARDRLAAMAGTRVAVLGHYGGGIRVDSVDDGQAGGGVLLRALGLTPVDPGAAPGTRQISDEELSRFSDVDAVVVQDFGTTTAQLLATPTFARLPAVRQGRVTRLDPAATRATYLLSSLSVPYAADALASALLGIRR
ncbi:ABC transporter substrate-binding protein [Pseudonocardia phyllosphaerae]|uniref:ABC transporter substrate-binding protein n=1 Tax=Pseudonocardia phyllosphaerae TaxID=3390502 RepID=UPI00397D9C77